MLRPLLRSRPILPNLAGHLARNPQQLERLVRSKWLLSRNFKPFARITLPAPLYVSLTSHPGRFATLGTTLKCLLMQSWTPAGVILWIAHEELAALPPDVRELERFGLQIRPCQNLRSYKKIIPALAQQPDAFWVTADDDCYYGPRWLERLVRAWKPYAREVICHRAHRLRMDDRGSPLPYAKWDLELRSASVHPLNFMTGVGGVLYPPGSLPPETLDETLFRRLCAGCDDIWLWWMLRRRGYWVRKVGGPWNPIHWPGTQTTSLYEANVVDGGNDLAVRNMIEHFGLPETSATNGIAA